MEGDVGEEPKSIQRLKASFRNIGTAEARRKAMEIVLGPDDVVISSQRKTGTTWTEQILHGLRSGGDMDFEEISFVIPEMEFALDYGYGELDQKQKYPPQMYRTHLPFKDIPKGAGKYIVIMRDPLDSAVSFYHYWVDWLFSKDEISADEFTEHFWLGHDDPATNLLPCQMQFVADWYEARKNMNVFWLHFEDLKQDLRRCVKALAEFLRLDSTDDSLIDLVTKQADISFMKWHKTKFDSHHIKERFNVAMDLDPNAGGTTAKVRDGEVGTGRTRLSQRVIDLVNKRWKDVVEARLGFRSYAEMRASINSECGDCPHSTTSVEDPVLKDSI